MKAVLLLIVCVLQGAAGAFASDSLSVRKKYVVAGFNAASYKGSLSATYARWTPAFQVGVKFQKKKILNGMLSLTFGKVIGEDRSYQRPANTPENIVPVSRFETSFISLQYEVQILLFHYRRFRLVASQGVGLFRFTPTDWDGNSLLDRDRTRKTGETYNTNGLHFPTQLGIQYGFGNDFMFGLQAGWLNPLTNYIDNMDQLSANSQGDNVAVYRFQLFVPIKGK